VGSNPTVSAKQKAPPKGALFCFAETVVREPLDGIERVGSGIPREARAWRSEAKTRRKTTVSSLRREANCMARHRDLLSPG
jgi:hypothetical protein